MKRLQEVSQEKKGGSFPNIDPLNSPNISQIIQKKLFATETLTKSNQIKNCDNAQKDTPKIIRAEAPAQLSFSKAETIKCQEENRLPELLDNGQTKQTRQKHFILKNTIDATIQELIRLHKRKNLNQSSEQLNAKKSQIMARLAFIFSEMNEIKDGIEDTIWYLNEVGSALNGSGIERQNTPIKKIDFSHSKISQEEQNEMINQQNNKDQQENFSPHGNVSLEERFQSNMESEFQ